MDTMKLPFNQTATHELYALVDCALIEGFYTQLSDSGHTEVMFNSLFANTVNDELRDLGPVLIKLNPEENEDWLTELDHIQQKRPTPIWIHSSLPFMSLFLFLRELLRANDNCVPQLCRYFDAKCFPLFLSSFNEEMSYFGRLRKMQFAIWQPEKHHYDYYDHNYRQSGGEGGA